MADLYSDFTANPFQFSDPDLLKLGSALDFGPEELAKNAEGCLALSQLKRLENDLRWKYWPLIIGFTLLAIFIGVAGLAILPPVYLIIIPVIFLMTGAMLLTLFLKREREGRPHQAVWSTRIEVGRIGLILRCWLFVIAVLAGLPQSFLIVISVTALTAEAALITLFFKQEREGLPYYAVWSTRIEVGMIGLTLRRRQLIYGSRIGHTFFMGTNGQRLFANRKLLNVMQPNQTYRAYYVHGISWSGARILSLEPIDERVYPEEKVKVKQKPKAKRQRNTL